MIIWRIFRTVRSLIYIILFIIPFGLFGQQGYEWKTESTTKKIDIEISIYPNPTIDFVTIESDVLVEDGSYILTNMIGKQLATGSLNSRMTTLFMDSYAKGIYMIRIFDSSGKKVTTRKILKE